VRLCKRRLLTRRVINPLDAFNCLIEDKPCRRAGAGIKAAQKIAEQRLGRVVSRVGRSA